MFELVMYVLSCLHDTQQTNLHAIFNLSACNQVVVCASHYTAGLFGHAVLVTSFPVGNFASSPHVPEQQCRFQVSLQNNSTCIVTSLPQACSQSI